jgi:hypothetical protein
VKKLRLGVLAVSTALLCALVSPPAKAVVKTGGLCQPWEDEQNIIDFDEDGVPHECVCRQSSRPGGQTCRWQPISGFQKQIQVTEWSTNLAHLNYAEIGTTPNGYFRSRGSVTNYVGNNGAALASPGYLANATVVYKWNGTVPGGRWEVCNDSGFYYNAATTYAVQQTWRFTTPPCGDNWYMTQSYGFVYSQGAWRGSSYGISSGFVGWNGCALCRTTMNASAGSPPPKNAPLPTYGSPTGKPPVGDLLRTINQVIPGLTVSVS